MIAGIPPQKKSNQPHPLWLCVLLRRGRVACQEGGGGGGGGPWPQHVAEPLPHGLRPAESAGGVHGVRGAALLWGAGGGPRPHRGGPPGDAVPGPAAALRAAAGLGGAGGPARAVLQQPAATARGLCCTARWGREHRTALGVASQHSGSFELHRLVVVIQCMQSQPPKLCSYDIGNLLEECRLPQGLFPLIRFVISYTLNT